MDVSNTLYTFYTDWFHTGIGLKHTSMCNDYISGAYMIGKFSFEKIETDDFVYYRLYELLVLDQLQHQISQLSYI